MCGEYGCLLSEQDRMDVKDTYISSLVPNWTMNAFPLESLPRELRDQIHEYALKEEEFPVGFEFEHLADPEDRSLHQPDRVMHLNWNNVTWNNPMLGRPPVGLNGFLQHRADLNVQRVSREMKNEHEETAGRWITLILKDCKYYDFRRFALPAPVAGVRWAVMYLALFCHSCEALTHESEHTCRAAIEVSKHVEWIREVLQQLSQLVSFRVLVYLAHSDYKYGQEGRLPCEVFVERKLRDLMALPKLETLRAFRYEFDDDEDFGGRKELIFEWTDGSRSSSSLT